MANAALDKAVAQIVGSYISLAVAFVVIAAISALVATRFSGKTRRQRKATFSLMSAICLLVYMTMIFPRILGAGAPASETVPATLVEATPGASGNTTSPETAPIIVANPVTARAEGPSNSAKEDRCNDQFQKALAAIPADASLADAAKANDRIQRRYGSCMSGGR